MSCIVREDPDQADIIELLRASDVLMAELYPTESNHLLDVAALQRPEVTFFVVREAGAAVGCGAWVRRDARGAELKRMFVTPAARGRRLGRGVLQAIEADAQKAGIAEMKLETGVLQPEALGLYRSNGYVECAPFAPYQFDPLSVFMSKMLGSEL